MTERKEPIFFGGPVWRKHMAGRARQRELKEQWRERERNLTPLEIAARKEFNAYWRKQNLTEWFCFLFGVAVVVIFFGLFG